MSKTNKIVEDAPAMSVGGNGNPPVPSLTSPEVQYASQLKRRAKKKMLKRAKPPGQPGVMVSDTN